MPEAFTLALTDPRATIETVGGKGASLAHLKAGGLPVPNGFCVTTEAYRQFVSFHGLQDQILAAASAASPDRPETLEDASAKIAQLFAQRAVPQEVTQAITDAYTNLGGERLPVAVRSSATAEDLPQLSFAGQQETYLNVRGTAKVLAAIQRCWASLWTARAIGYRARNGIAHQTVSLAVVIQELVPAEASGVLFTADPMTGKSDRVVINAAWGLGEAIVGGKVTPDAMGVEKASGRVTDIRTSPKEVMTIPAGEGTQEEWVPTERRNRSVLSRAQARELARLGVKTEKLFGLPMDLEWALARGRIYLLQARPITALPGHNPAQGEWNDSLAGDFLWTRANYGEAVPDVMTPCTWSLVQILLDNADPGIGSMRQYGNIGGRLYANLSQAASIAAIMGIGPKRFAAMVADGFGRLPEGLEIPLFHLSLGRMIPVVLPAVIGTLQRVRANQRKLRDFLRTAPERCQALRERIQATSDAEGLSALWERQARPFFIETCQMLEAAANQGGAAILFTRQRLQKLVGEQDADALLTGPTADWGHLASLGPLLGLSRLAKGEISREAFARQYGHRSPHEIEVSTPRPAEDPGWIETQLAGLREAKDDADALLARQESTRQEAWTRLHVNFPRKEASVRRQIDRWATVAHEREAARSEVIRAFWVLRALALCAGTITGLGQDIFFLSLGEILALLHGDRSSLAFVPSRRAAYERYCALPSYPVLIRGQFDPFKWSADPHRRSDLADASSTLPLPAGEKITGFTGARGVVEGRARVLRSAEEGDQLQAGEVLVTTVTNVGWTPLFPRAAAVVTDIGAPLSHAAIVARELGIPAVVGCGNATMRLHSGDRVRVDGGRGTVEILRAAP